MSVISKDELITKIRGVIGEEPSQEGIEILEDVTDTFSDFESKVGEDWKSKYEENDKEWKRKYTERFYSPEPQDSNNSDSTLDDPKPDEVQLKTKYEELFETV